MTYNALIDERRMELQTEAQRIEHAVSSLLEETQTLMVYAGKRIVHEGTDNPQAIWKHIFEVLGRKELYGYTPYWPTFFWLNEQNWQIINGTFGILAAPVDLSFRKYTSLVRQKPWALFLDPPDFGRPSNRWIIPGGLGVRDADDQFLGVIAVAFEIAQLTQHINATLVNPSIEYAIFNNNLNPIIYSSQLIEFQSLNTSLQTGIDSFLKTDQSMQKKEQIPLLDDYYITPIPSYPLVVITYLKENSIFQQWLRIFIPHILEMIAICLSSLIILIYFWKHIRKKNQELDETQKKMEYVLALTKASDFAKEDFLRSTQFELKQPLNAIEKNVEILSRNLKKENDTELVLDRQVELLDEILNEALNFKNLTNSILNIREIDLISLVKECVTIHSKQVYDKKITLEVQADEKQFMIQADELKIKQVLVGLLSKAIHVTSADEKISITLSKKEVKGTEYVQIVIQNREFKLSNDALQRMAANLEHSQQKIDHFDMDISTIEHLIYMHNGSCFVKNHLNHASSMTILLPIYQPLISKKQTQFYSDHV